MEEPRVDPALPTGLGVLVQDPHILVRQCLRVVLESMSGTEVIAEATTHQQVVEKTMLMMPDLVIMDLSDKPSALAALEHISRNAPKTKVIGLADSADGKLFESALRAGAAGFALKTDSVPELMDAMAGIQEGGPRVAASIAAPLLQNYVEILKSKRSRDAGIIEALASAVEAKDSFTGNHIRRVALLAGRVAAEVDPSLARDEQLHFGFVLHDVGKIGIPEEILRKTSPLSRDEWEIMRTHPLIGMQIIAPLGLDAKTQDVVRHHHERWDGSGYPDGLGGEDIPLAARIFSVADTFDAMTSDRPYRRGTSAREAVREIVEHAGRQHDPMVVEGFVRLADRELAS